MELPHGTLLKSFKGPIPLADLNAALLKDVFTGFMRASLLTGNAIEGVVIYSNGNPIVAFTSDARADHPDNEQKAVASIIASEDSAIELFGLNEGQLRLAIDFSRGFLIKQPPPLPPPVKVEAPRPMPVQRPRAEKPASFPEVRGTFIKSESVDSLRSYIDSRKDETGHTVLTGQDGAREYHLLFLKGKVVAAYSSNEAGPAFLSGIISTGGVAEFYHVDDAIVLSILKMYPHVTASYGAAPETTITPAAKEPARAKQAPKLESWPGGFPQIPLKHEPGAPPVTEAPKPQGKPGPMETHRYEAIPRQGIGVPAKSLFDRRERSGADGMGMPAPESKSTGTLKGEVDDDADFVKKVEKEFVGNVDDLLKRLELSHLKVVPDKKKRL